MDKMERMERKKMYFLLQNQKQTLVVCSFNGKEVDSVLKFDGKEWVGDSEVDEVVRRCVKLDLMDKIAKKITSDYQYDKILNQKRQARIQADKIAEKELIEKIEQRDSDNSDDTK